MKTSDFKQFCSLLRTNFKSLLLFELIFKLITAVFVLPIFWLLFTLSLSISGIEYLGNDTLGAYISNPINWIIILIGILFIGYFSFVEISAIVSAFHQSNNKAKISVSQMFGFAINSAKKIIIPKNWGTVFLILFLLPFTTILPLSGIVTSITLPEFISDFIVANNILFILTSVAFALLSLLALSMMFVIHRIILTDESFALGIKNSFKLIKKKRIKTILKLFASVILIELSGILLMAILFAVAMLIIQIFCEPASRHNIAAETFNTIIIVISSLWSLFGGLVGFALISVYYYSYCKAENIAPAKDSLSFNKLKKSHTIAIASVIVVFTALAVISSVMNPAYIQNVTEGNVQSVAHRGYSTDYPENNMPAFEKAIEVKADYIELDVHQTKDGVVVVTHDANIKRIAGVDKNVYDLTFDELEIYDVGSWFSEEYKGLKVATLDEVIKLCKGKIKIQIELKPTGNEPDFEKNVIEIVRSNGFEKDCLIGSMNKDSLKKVKELAPDLKTLYIMTTAVGDLSGIDFADCFSVESSCISSDFTSEIHAQSKKCYVWTLNQEESMEYAIADGVDGIVSDDPTLVQKVVVRNGINSFVISLTDFIYGKN